MAFLINWYENVMYYIMNFWIQSLAKQIFFLITDSLEAAYWSWCWREPLAPIDYLLKSMQIVI